MTGEVGPTPEESGGTAINLRLFGWFVLAAMFVFVLNAFLTFGAGLPGAVWLGPGKGELLSWLQLLLYPAGFVVAAAYVLKTKYLSLRADGDVITGINTYFIRAAFWVVFLVGLVDMAISFLRVEEYLAGIVGEQTAKDLARSNFRGPYVHMPILLLSLVVAKFSKSLGFHWLALLIVVAELAIVIARFVFSYEQAFMADLVRYWYGAFFLFASAYTLLEEGHVRVDVFYAGFQDKTKGMINVVGSLTMGIVFCWTILLVGMSTKSSIINSPIFNFEVTQSGFGMYVKYMMAGFLGIFAISMMIQFVGYLFCAWADYKGMPGKRLPGAEVAH